MVEIVNGYMYPFRGILYMLRKKQLRKNSYLPIIFSLIIDLVVLILMFKFAYTPQYNLINDHILTFFWTWLNKVITVLIVIIEVYIVAMIVIVCIFLRNFKKKKKDINIHQYIIINIIIIYYYLKILTLITINISFFFFYI